jgi:hypothetical protein
VLGDPESNSYIKLNKNKKMEKLGALLAALGLLALAAIILAWPVQLLWNYSLIGAVNCINPITFWQALGISFLCSILFKNSNSK